MNTTSLQVPTVATRRAQRGAARVSIAITASVLLALSALASMATTQHALAAGTRPTIVLVHGAWAGPAGWDQVVALLHEAGYETVTPTLDEATLTGDANTVRAALDGIDGPKILVGHSYGGMVISNAGAGRSDVLALVYTAGLVPAPGESAFSVQEGYRQTAAVDHLVFHPQPFAYIDPMFFPQIFCQDLSPEEAAVLNVDQRPASIDALSEPSGPVAWQTLPSWYAISGQDLVIDPAVQDFMSKRAGSTVVRFDDASHAGGFTRHAGDLVQLIEQAVSATAV